MRRSCFGPIALVALLLGGCAGDPPAQTPVPAEPEEESLTFQPVAAGLHSGVHDTMEVVVRDAATWAAFADTLDVPRELPGVDFSQLMVLVAAVPAESSGYEVEFSTVERVEGRVRATYILRVPGGDCIAGQVLTSPFQVIQVPGVPGQVEFVRERQVYSCAMG